MSNIVIYHGDCVDGFTAAWVARAAFAVDAPVHFRVG